MVRINIEQQELDKLVEQHWKAVVSPPYSLFEELFSFESDVATQKTDGASQHNFLRLLNIHFRNIITSSPIELQKLASILKPAYDKVLADIRASTSDKKEKDKLATNYKESILKIFNYKKFTTDSPAYRAYTLAEALNVNVCPYCNRQYTFTLNTKTGKTRPEFDHFFDKARYPFFALSFYNLIPSCHICNSNLKGTKNFQYDTHLNPYAACFDQVLKFSIDVKKADFINGVKKDYNLSLKPLDGIDPTLVKKAMENAKVFKHEHLYDRHKDLVSELIQRAYYYTDSRIKELRELSNGEGKPLFQDEEEIKRFITGVYTEAQDLGKRPMSKLIKDISEDLR